MTWVKVCGMRSTADLEAAAEAGADAVGMVLIEGSPRCLGVQEAVRLSEKTDLPTVILTSDLGPEQILDLMERIGASGVQPYGEHSDQAARAAEDSGALVLRPTRLQGPVNLDLLPEGQIPLLDSYTPDRLGGTGKTIPASWLPEPGTRYVLAGGLNPSNVAEAVGRYRPWGVDASSGLESSPGVKDPALIMEFVRNAKEGRQ